MHPQLRRNARASARQLHIERLESRQLLSAGQLDPRFGLGGKASLDQVGPSNDSLADVIVQSNGKIIVAGTRARQPMLERYLPDGKLDPTFGQGDIVTVPGDASHNSFSKIAVDSSGHLAALSQPFDFISKDTAEIYRFNSDGSPDPGFGAQGELQLATGEDVHDMTMQSSGKIVFSASLASESAPQLVRLNGDGSIDGTFNPAIDDFSSPIFALQVNQVIAEPDDSLLLAGATNNSGWEVARLLSDGALDTNFGAGGLTNISIGSSGQFGFEPTSLSLGADGKILLAVNVQYPRFGAASPLALARLNSDGSMDESFGSVGTTIIDPASLGLSAYFDSAELAPDDGVILTSRANEILPSTAIEGVEVRLTPAGSVDAAFASNGIYGVAAPGAYSTELGGAAITLSGQIYLAGTAFLASTAQSETMLVRINSDGANDPTFGDGGLVTTQGSNSYNTRTSALFQPDGKTIFLNRNFAAPYSLMRMTASGKLDQSFGDYGIVNITLPGYVPPTLIRAILQPDGKIVAVGWDSALGQNYSHLLVIRFDRNGRYDATFGNHGVVPVNLGGNEFGNSIALQSDGKIIISGEEEYYQQFSFIVRLNTNGSLDSTFGAGGIAQLPVIGFDPRVFAIYPMRDGSTLLWSDTGLSNGQDAEYLEKLDAYGAIDSTYGSNGIQFLSLPDGFFPSTPPLMTPDGHLLALLNAGDVNATTYDLLRLNLDGSPDSNFGVDGLLGLPGVAPDENLHTLAIAPDGQIVLAGSTQSNTSDATTSDMLAIRLDSDGSIDSTFGQGGGTIVDFNGLFDRAESIGFARNGDVILAGESTGASTLGDDAKARLFGSNRPPFFYIPIILKRIWM